MLRRFLFLSVGLLALVYVIGSPGQVHARHSRNGFQGGYSGRPYGGYSPRYYGDFGRRFQGGYRNESFPGFRSRSADDFTVGPFGGLFPSR